MVTLEIPGVNIYHVADPDNLSVVNPAQILAKLEGVAQTCFLGLRLFRGSILSIHGAGPPANQKAGAGAGIQVHRISVIQAGSGGQHLSLILARKWDSPATLGILCPSSVRNTAFRALASPCACLRRNC